MSAVEVRAGAKASGPAAEPAAEAAAEEVALAMAPAAKAASGGLVAAAQLGQNQSPTGTV